MPEKIEEIIPPDENFIYQATMSNGITVTIRANPFKCKNLGLNDGITTSTSTTDKAKLREVQEEYHQFKCKCFRDLSVRGSISILDAQVWTDEGDCKVTAFIGNGDVHDLGMMSIKEFMAQYAVLQQKYLKQKFQVP